MIKINKKIIFTVFIFGIVINTLNAQEKSEKVTRDLHTIIDKSNSFKEYKVIEKKAILNFESTLNNYIQQEKSTQSSLRTQLSANEKKIITLQKQLDEFKSKNETLVAEKANINFLGFSISKESYSITMWALFLGALAAAVILFLSFKRANKVTKESKSLLADLEEEYQNYRGVCVEREQSLRRQLFDAVKKSKDLKNVS